MESAILKKLQALHIMAQRGTRYEAENAKRLFEKLLDKYGVKESELQEKRNRQLDCPYNMQSLALHICFSLDLNVYRFKNRRKSPLLIESTDSEFAILNDLLRQVRIVFKQQRAVAKTRLDSYMYGFMEATYPVTKEDPACPMCGEKLMYVEIERRYKCGCGYAGKKIRVRQLYGDDVMAGKLSSGRMIESRAL